MTLEEDFLFIPAEDIPPALDAGIAESAMLAAAAALRSAPVPRGSLPAPRGRMGGAGAKLASAVEEIRAAEDDIQAGALTAEGWLRKLAASGAHADSGYATVDDFELRILSFTPFVEAIRGAMPLSRGRKGRAAGRGRGAADARARRAQAFASIAEGLDELRVLDRDMRAAARRAREALARIEARRLYEECGYATYEEFIERALWKSPVLATALAMCDGEPIAEPARGADPPATGDDGRADDAAPAVSGSFRAATAAAPALDAAHAPEAPAAVPALARAPRVRALQFAVSAVLCLVATFAGAAAGTWTSAVPSPREGAEVTAAAKESVTPAASGTAGAPKGHGSPSAPAASPARKAHEETAVPTSATPHAHPSGPREARR